MRVIMPKWRDRMARAKALMPVAQRIDTQRTPQQ
jgi:hypothetical protein